MNKYQDDASTPKTLAAVPAGAQNHNWEWHKNNARQNVPTDGRSQVKLMVEERIFELDKAICELLERHRVYMAQIEEWDERVKRLREMKLHLTAYSMGMENIKIEPDGD